MVDRSSEARELLEKASRKNSEFTFFGLVGSREAKLEEASDMCAKAGNLYKIEKKWKEAGDAYMKAADYALQMDDRDSASSQMVEASKVYKKINPEGTFSIE